MTATTEPPQDVEETIEVFDETEVDDVTPHPRYDITSYGSDPDVEGLVRRLNRGEILIPAFQRDYVWKMPEAARFIESLLLGLPVPGVFFSVESGTGRLLVIDGQQRLRSLQFFYSEVFNPKPDDKKRRVFALVDVHPKFEGKTYSTLEEPDRLRLDNSVIHATIVKQDAPAEDDTSIFHIFERLNSGGKKLAPQEIRAALYHGSLIDLLRELDQNPAWRSVFGKPNPRLKDEELILRYLALLMESDLYERPMAEFLNKFTARHAHGPDAFLRQARESFVGTIERAASALGSEAFRPERSLNAAVFDSAMVGLTHLLRLDPSVTDAEISERYKRLLGDEDYQISVSRSTADESFVRTRLSKAIEALTSPDHGKSGTQ